MPAPPPSSPPEQPAPAGAADDPLGDLPADRAVFDRGYVEKVRGEAQRYRTEARASAEQLQTYNDVFDGYDPADVDVWFRLARDWKTDPRVAAQAMMNIANDVLGEQDPVRAAPDDGTQLPPAWAAAADDSLTPDRVKALIEESLNTRDQSRAEQDAITGIFAEVRAAGYDPESSEGFALLYDANHFTNGDIPKAIERAKAREQKIIDDYVSGRTKSYAAPAPSGGQPGSSAPPAIASIEDARKATEAFLRERRQAQ